MHFHIDGRFQADVRFENNAWTVQPVKSRTHPAPPDMSTLSDPDEDDIASFLDDIFLQAEQERHG